MNHLPAGIHGLLIAIALLVTSFSQVQGASTSTVQAREIKPTWELGVNTIDPALTNGAINVVDGVVKLDGASTFSIPIEALGGQQDYTIEFELRIPTEFEPMSRKEGSLSVISNTDANENAGLCLLYRPLGSRGGWDNAFQIIINGYDTGKLPNLGGHDFTRYTIVAKERSLMIYRNGMLLTMTGEVNPSKLPLTVGEILAKPLPVPYELRNVRVYDQALPPTDDEPDAKMMRNVSGEGYSMQRVDIEDPSLPRILVVGDSISGGYRTFITKHFKGKAYVDYWVGSGWFDWTVKEDDFPVLRAWKGVLSNGPYDVVSWNSMTLHMWTPRDPGRSSIEKYPDQMRRVVEHLQKIAPDTQFIWVNCTPYTTTVEGKDPVINHEKSQRLVMFNEATDKIMKQYGIPIIDLYGLCVRNPGTAYKDSIHWNGDGYSLMADEIIKEIEKSITTK